MQSDYHLALLYMGGSSVFSTPLGDTEQALETNEQHTPRVGGRPHVDLIYSLWRPNLRCSKLQVAE